METVETSHDGLKGGYTMADYQIGDNLYANAQGKYYRLNNGQQSYEESPFETMSNKINALYDSQKKNQLDQLKSQRDKAIAGYTKQKTDLKPVYQNQRNQADVVNAQNVARLRELMAAQGINASGENLTTQAGMASARQSSLGEITSQENQAIGEIDQRINEENDTSRDQAIINSVETERSGRLADAWNQSQQEIYQKYQDWRNYQEQLRQQEWQRQMEEQRLAMEKQQFELQQKMRELEYQRALAGGSSGGGGGGSRTSSKTSATTVKAAPAVKTAATTNQSALDRYYTSPAIQSVERLKQMSPKNYALNKAFDSPVPPAKNPNLSAWAKMKMLGL
jgi:hypothetical protein